MMVQTLQASNVNLRVLIDTFGLQRRRDDQFFGEWREDLPELTDSEKQFLNKVKEGFLNLVDHPPIQERAVQVSILGPMLFLADFYLPPFHIQTEKSIEISEEDEGVVIRGQVDILLVKEQFWIMVIESKGFSFSTEAGLAQLLAYMLANPHSSRPGFGMMATGGIFQFVKLVQGNPPQYAISDQFGTLNQVNGIYEVFRILKRIGQL
ncbi:restriction endonuclease subunit R [Kovacikia minuta CCNUW1]|uniref:restriction endonuclease subunit R n=1 Tax=Kovacikia minuta TaxID=2931930 RepID=UPI001CC94726|nr:restriction endonuclease subunit R [Kovacikia minuta]UBF29349.1 restriction endonuclease subunit R [Kovacikia minuta CCNUW1]